MHWEKSVDKGIWSKTQSKFRYWIRYLGLDRVELLGCGGSGIGVGLVGHGDLVGRSILWNGLINQCCWGCPQHHSPQPQVRKFQAGVFWFGSIAMRRRSFPRARLACHIFHDTAFSLPGYSCAVMLDSKIWPQFFLQPKYIFRFFLTV